MSAVDDVRGQWTALGEILAAATGAPAPRSVYQALLDGIAPVFSADSGSLVMAAPDGMTFTILAIRNLPTEVLGRSVLPGEGVMGWVAGAEEPLLLLGKAANDPRFGGRATARRHVPGASICWPLWVHGELVGLLNLNRAPGAGVYHPQDLERGRPWARLSGLVLDDIRQRIAAVGQTAGLGELSRRQVLLSEARAWAYEMQENLQRESSLEGFCQGAVFHALHLAGARFGRMALFDRQGREVAEALSGVGDNPLAVLPRGAEWLAPWFREGETLNVWRSDAGPSPGLAEEGGLLGAPVLCEGRLSGALFLLKPAGEFSLADKMVIDLFLGDMRRTLERHALMVRLSEANEELEAEKGHQQKLIEEITEAQGRLRKSERLASVGQLAAGLAHELNTPLGYVRSNFEALGGYLRGLLEVTEAYEEALALLPEGESRRRLEAARAAADLCFLREDAPVLLKQSFEGLERMGRIVRDLGALPPIEEVLANVDLGRCLDEALDVLRPRLESRIRVVREYAALPTVPGVVSRIRQVLLNLLVNAVQAIDGEGVITLRTGCNDAGWVWVSVADSGEGIGSADRERVFDPFFTTRPVGSGEGLGLSLAYSIVHRHHGRIEVEQNPGGGALFTVWLPTAGGPGTSGGTGRGQ